ncbi:MAG: response regulator [Myxococcaceae bacterium]
MRTVLVVDDHAETCEFLTALLRMRGMNVLAVCDSTEAQNLILRGLQPSLVVTDYRMPGLSGLDLISGLRTDPRTEQLPVVLLSASRITDRGDPYTVILRKPFDPEAFADLVEELSTARLFG